MPVDHTFDMTLLRTGPVLDAARRSVLVPLFGPGAAPAAAHPKYCTQLLWLWRKRVSQLRKVGYLDEREWMFRRNCPPFGVAGSRKLRCCYQPSLCPWCYMRQHVVGPVYRFAGCLASKGPGLTLVSFVSRAFFPDLESAAAECALRPPEVDALGGKAAIVSWQLAGAHDEFQVRRAGFVAVRGEPPELAPSVEARAFPASRGALFSAVPRVFAFSPWALRGDPEALVKVLEANKRRRMCAGYGDAFRARP